MVKLKRRRCAASPAEASAEAAAKPEGAGAEAAEAAAPAEPGPAHAKRTKRRSGTGEALGPLEQADESGPAAAEAQEDEEVDAPAGWTQRGGMLEVAQAAQDDKKGIVHLGCIPAFMAPLKMRHIMEKFGEIGRVYLQPEDNWERTKRKRKGGNKKQRYTEGWVEFLDRRMAKRVALSLNGTTMGGGKRNFYRDDLWNVRYLPKFKWTQLKEGAVYNKMVRKARLEQKIGQATKENSLYLERVHENKVRGKIQDRRAKKATLAEGQEPGAAAGDAKQKPGQSGKDKFAGKGGEAPPRFPKVAQAKQPNKDDFAISDRVLRSLFACD